MRILYLTNESPIFPAGGIGTYIQYMAKAMEDAGHEVFLLTWVYGQHEPVESYFPFRETNVRIVNIFGENVWKQYSHGPYNLALANLLKPEIEKAVRDWQIDVVEGTDFLSPALPFYQEMQNSGRGKNLLCVSYNHGFIEDFYDADQIQPTESSQNDLVGERQQLRISDLVIAPSLTAMRRLAAYGINENVSLIREPYQFASATPLGEVQNGVSYLGRISFAKGIDKLILFSNVVDEVLPLSTLILIGKTVNTPFRIHDIEAYIRRRLKPRLRDLVFLTGMLKRDVALSLLRPGSIAPSLGSAETFSYACIETIDNGQLPVVRKGTPMAEFFPDHLQDYTFDETFTHVNRITGTFEKLLADGGQVLKEVQEVNQEALDPERIANQMSDEYDQALRAKRGFSQVQVRQKATANDITILMPIHKPESIIMETVESLVHQTVGVPRVLICDDGTPQQDRHWFDYCKMRLPDCTIIRQPNTGLLGARNTLVEAAPSRLSMFLDADDIFEPTMLEKTLEAYNNNPTSPNAVMMQRFNYFESDEIIIRHLQHDHVHMMRNDYRMTALIETDILREIGFDMTRRNGEGDDWIFWLEFTAAGYSAVMVPEPLFRYRFRTGSMSWPWSMGQTAGTLTMVRQALATLAQRRPEQARMISRALFSKMNCCE